jgi:hypothetical protein
MGFNFVGDIRFEKAFSGPSFSAVEVTKSSYHCPGQIFTLDTDYKTRAYATYAVDDPDAIRISKPAAFGEGPRPIPVAKNTTIAIPGGRPASVSKESRNASCRIPFKKVKDVKVIERDNRVTSAGFPLDQMPKVAKFKGGCFTTMKANNPMPQTEPFVPPEYNPNLSASSAGENKYKNTATGEHPSTSSSELSSLPPAHQIHNRMMGWKLTSPERRKELLSMLEHAQLSASTVEDNSDVIAAISGRGNVTGRRPGTGEGDLEEARRIAQRQAEAMEVTIG